MTNAEACRIITEKLFEGCWHEWQKGKFIDDHIHYRCGKCHAHRVDQEPENEDYSSDTTFLVMWDKLRENSGKWLKFLDYLDTLDEMEARCQVIILLGNRSLFVQMVAEFLMEEAK